MSARRASHRSALVAVLAAAVLAWARPASALSASAPIAVQDGLVSFVSGTAANQVPAWNNSLSQWELLAFNASDFSFDFSGDAVALDASVTQLGSCIGEVGDFCAYPVQLTSTTSCPSTDCDAAGEFGRLCLLSGAAQGRFCFCFGTGGWYCTGDLENIAVATADSSAITNTTTETAFSNGNMSLSANGFAVGAIFYVHAGGKLSTAAGSPGTLTLRFRWGSTNTDPLVLDFGASPTLATSLSNDSWSIDAVVTVRSVGASGTVVGAGSAQIPASTSDATSVVLFDQQSSTTTIDTTAAKTPTLFALWSTASASNTITLETWTVTRRNKYQ